MRVHAATTLAMLATALLPALAHAAWPNSPFTNLPVSTATNVQSDPRVVSDGAGGVIVSWVDFRNGVHEDIYAQHVLPSGTIDPAWPAGGLPVCSALTGQIEMEMISDGAGGAILTWRDRRNAGQWDIYAQRVLASGAVDPAWPVDGRMLKAAGNNDAVPSIASDGAGGAIVTWMDFRNGIAYDIYATRVLASGEVDPAWPYNGRSLCAAANNQSEPMIVPDGAGGAIVTWQDYRSGMNDDVYAQHVLASGALDPGWPADGRALCTSANSQLASKLVSDGLGGAFVTWHDYRSGLTYDLYAHHVRASGVLDPVFPAQGLLLCSALLNQRNPAIVSDGTGGALISWEDARSGSGYDIYAMHLLASGLIDPAWPVDGRALCVAAGDQIQSALVPDGAGGAFVTWLDYRNAGYTDIYAQHVVASGGVDFAWPADGRALTNATNHQYSPVIALDEGAPGGSGAIVAWTDNRLSSSSDIYAQRVESFGRLGNPEPVIASVQDVPYDDGGHVKVSWAASYLDAMPFNEITSYEVWRSIPPGLAQAALARGARGHGALAPQTAGRREAPRSGEIRASANGTATIYWEYVGSQPARRFAGYSYNLSTTGDSVGAGVPVLQVQILALDGDGSSMWASAPASGYSVDNIAPAAPAPFTGQFAAGTTHMH